MIGVLLTPVVRRIDDKSTPPSASKKASLVRSGLSVKEIGELLIVESKVREIIEDSSILAISMIH